MVEGSKVCTFCGGVLVAYDTGSGECLHCGKRDWPAVATGAPIGLPSGPAYIYAQPWDVVLPWNGAPDISEWLKEAQKRDH